MGHEERELVELRIPQADLRRVMEVLSPITQTQVSQVSHSEPFDPILKCRALLFDRQKREMIFGKAMFGETPWDMLLALFARADSEGLSVEKLAEQSNVLTRIAKRWLEYLEQQGLVDLKANRFDTRKEMASLTEKGRERMHAYLRAITIRE